MEKIDKESIEFIKQIGCTNKYYSKDYYYWFDGDPSVIFIINEDGTIEIRDLFSNQQKSIETLFGYFSLEQKKIIIFNIDKFK